MVYVMRLKGTSRVNATLERQGIAGVDVRSLGVAPAGGSAAAAAAAAAPALQ